MTNEAEGTFTIWSNGEGGSDLGMKNQEQQQLNRIDEETTTDDVVAAAGDKKLGLLLLLAKSVSYAAVLVATE